MKEFNDLKFEQSPYLTRGIRARMKFDNGWGISVIQNEFSYGGWSGLYEIAVLNSKEEISYESGLTEDVVGWLDKEGVSEWMEKIQNLT